MILAPFRAVLFSIISLIGYLRASERILMPTFSLLSSISPPNSLSNILDAWYRATPPPGITPYYIALFAELRASTIRSLSSPLSASVPPPIYISAIRAYILASLSSCTPLICLDSSKAIVSFISWHLFSNKSLFIPPPTIWVNYSLTVIILAEPKCFISTSLSFKICSLSIRVAPVIAAISLSISFYIPFIQGIFTAWLLRIFF